MTVSSRILSSSNDLYALKGSPVAAKEAEFIVFTRFALFPNKPLKPIAVSVPGE